MTDPEPFRALGIDLGTVRIGLAVSDPGGSIALPLETVERIGPRQDLERIARRVREVEACAVVVGLPKLLSGEEGEQAAAAREFAERLSRRLGDVPVALWDERLTTVEAERTMISGGVSRRRRKASVDPMAAALILQGWLDARANMR
ncbi:MAG TPA: Holliday junction resolvase RuvX [Planctomycetota bacterium]|nr:Holliday junction resolvase RuvX [Planctomycetota bacterium]